MTAPQEQSNAPRETAQDLDRARELANALDCEIEEDVALLTRTKPPTVEAWRKRGVGPAYALIGNRFVYPRPALREFIAASVRTRIRTTGGEL